MRKTALITALVVAAVAVLTVIPFSLGDGPGGVAHAAALERFDGCEELLSYLKEQANESVTPYGLDGGGLVYKSSGREVMPAMASAEGAPDLLGSADTQGFSRTNVQEDGVDEPDLVKTDGKHLFTAMGGVLRAVDLSDGAERSVGSLPLEGDGHQLLLAGDRLLVLANVVTPSMGDPGIPVPQGEVRLESMMIAPTESLLSEVDVSDPENMRVLRTLKLDGSRGAARLIGDVARVVVHSNMPETLRSVYPVDGDETSLKEALAANRRVIDTSSIEDWLPGYTFVDLSDSGSGNGEGPLVECARAHRPPEPAGLGMTSVVSVDLSKGLEIGNPTAVVTGSDNAYASAESLYIATAHWQSLVHSVEGDVSVQRSVVGSPVASSEPWTSVHRFDLLGDGEAEYRSSGRVDGTVKDQWSFSEHDGFLRVTTTEQRTSGAGTEFATETDTGVSVLDEEGNRLVEVGRVGGLGRGEQVYAVRYIGDLGFVVTFRQTDPLYVIDLSNPKTPRVTGELKIPGYSSYLHPLGDGRLLGLGQDATEEGRTLGTQLSIFDVSDPSRPARITKLRIADGSNSPAEWDHHAFLYWEPSGLVVVPLQQWGASVVEPVESVESVEPGGDGVPQLAPEPGIPPGQFFNGVAAFQVGSERDQLRELGRFSHPSSDYGSPVERSIVVGARLLTLSQSGLMVSALDDLKQINWIAW